MRIVAALAAALLATNVFATPTKPDQALVDNIQTVLDARKEAKTRADNSESRMKAIEREIGLRDEQDVPLPLNLQIDDYAKRLLGLGNETLEKYARLSQEHKLAQQELRSLSDKAIKLATAAYKPVPAISSGDIASGPPQPVTSDDVPSYIGNPVAYAPAYSERVPDGKSGATDDAGKVLIGPGAFDSPGKLAFTLYHEGEHFERLLTPGLDLRNIPNEEVLTRTRQRPLLKSIFGLTDKEVASFDEVLASERIRAKKWDTLLTQGLDPYKKSQQMAFPGGYKPLWLEDGVSQEIDNILARTKELRDLEKAESERRRREAEARQERERVAQWQQLDGMAVRCGYKMAYQRSAGDWLGFERQNSNIYFVIPYKTPLRMNDVEAALLVADSCYDIHLVLENRMSRPSGACNSAASQLSAVAAQPDFRAKLDYIFGNDRYRNKCIDDLFNHAAEMTDTSHYDKFVAKYAKQVKKDAEESDRRWHPKVPDSSPREPSREPRRAPPSDDPRRSPDHDEVWRRINPIIR